MVELKITLDSKLVIGAHFVNVKAMLNEHGDSIEVILRHGQNREPIDLITLCLDGLRYATGPIKWISFSGDLDKREGYQQVTKIIESVVELYNKTSKPKTITI